MAQLGKFERTILDNEGNPLSGISVAIYNQGASLSAAGSNPYTVYDPGALTTAYTVQANTNSAITKSVTAVAATSITTQGIGLGSLVATDRLVGISPTPTLYQDATGTTSIGTNVLTTDANGYCTCWIAGGAYDLIISGTGYSTRLVTDFIVAAEKRGSNAFDAAGTPGWIFGMGRTVTLSPIQEWHNPIGTRKCYITASGGFTGVAGTFSGALSTTSTLSVTGASTLTGVVTTGTSVVVGGGLTASGGISGTTGTFSSTLTASSGFTMTAGTFSVPANTLSKTSVASGTTDATITAGAGFGTITGDGAGSLVAVTLTPASTASEIIIMCIVPIETTGAGATLANARVKNGATVLTEGEQYMAFGGANLGSVITLLARQTGLSGSQTWTLEVSATTTNGIIKSSTTDRKARLVVIEHKF